MVNNSNKIALVLSGGGARGAYEVGILYHLRKNIWPDQHGFSIHCGTSAGTLNTCYLASTAHDPKNQGKNLKNFWENLKSTDIYKGDFAALSQFLLRSATYTTTHLTRAFGCDCHCHHKYRKWKIGIVYR